MTALPTLDQLAGQLAVGSTTSRALVEACLEAIAAAGVEGERVFPHGVAADAVRAEADRQDRLRREGRTGSPFAGIPISLKDNIDQAGQVTRAGTRLFAQNRPAEADAAVAARLRAAWFVVVGRTNMTELAFSGLGTNPHYGTPRNPRSPDVARIPGGSSAGAAVSVASGMAIAAVGTDTGGSCRIPAAFCGLVGFKPTGRRVPRDGVYPLSTTLDCVGPLARSARDCAIMDAIMAGEAVPSPTAPEDRPLRLALVETYVVDDMDAAVAAAYDAALARLRAAGVILEPVQAGVLAEVATLNARGGLSSAELYGRLRERLATEAGVLDPRVLRRVAMGAESTEAGYRELHQTRARLIAEADAALLGFDAIVMPTIPVVAPRFAELEADADYDRLNRLVLRNSAIANMLDRPAITLPCEPPGALPVGLTLMGASGEDAALLRLAERLEAVVRAS